MVSYLELFEGHLLLSDLLGDQVAVGLHARGVVLHVQGDGTPGLGAAAHMVELEAHQCLHKGCT